MIAAERAQNRAQRARPEPRRAYSFARAGHLWTPKRERLELLGGGPCGSFAARGAAAGGYSPLSPPGFSSLLSWLDVQRLNSLTWNTLLEKSGSGTPPDVSLSGTPTRHVNLRVEVNDVTGGTARGQAKFRWSEDGGTNWTSGVTTAASTTLGTTGFDLAWSTGTYATDHVYVGKIVQINDLTGLGNHYENVLSTGGGQLPRISLTGLNGKPSLLFDGTDDFLRRGDSTYCTALCGGNDTPSTRFTVGQIVANPTNEHFYWSVTNTTLSTSEISLIGFTSQWTVSARGTTGSELLQKGGTTDINPHIFEYVRHGTTVSLLVTDVGGTTTTVINAAAQDANSLTVTEAFLGAIRSGANLYGNVRIGEDLAYTGALDAATRANIRAYLARKWSF